MSKPIDLQPGRAVFVVLNAAVQTETVRIALAAYLEGAGIEGQYTLELTGARLMPAESRSGDSPASFPDKPMERG